MIFNFDPSHFPCGALRPTHVCIWQCTQLNQPAVMHKCNVCRWLHYKHWLFLVCISDTNWKDLLLPLTLMATITWWCLLVSPPQKLSHFHTILFWKTSL